jgi:Zn-dependent protease with chaperone function
VDFFAHQDRARRSTTWLVVLFALAVLLLVAGTDAVTYLGLSFANNRRPLQFEEVAEILALTSLATLGLIAAGSFYKTWSLRSGGAAVAELMGATPIEGGGATAKERILLNVVEEMAIASGVAVPRVFVMRNEPGINAFAAGLSRDDAVIAVTQGCLDTLNRDELQAVVGHEFSHLLNGDMRLNLRLIGVLHGILILYLIGRIILEMFGRGRVRRRDGKDNGAGAILLFGLALVVLGSLGLFFGRLIKAAVSRQREYLADASSVQFTRNPSAMANALKKIGASYGHARITNAHAEEVSHLFIGQAFVSWLGWYATHPPTERRHSAKEPGWE